MIEVKKEKLVKKEKPEITIGYYPIRGKAQVPRLLCEYLKVPYEDQLFQLMEWRDFKLQEAKNWDFQDCPFLKQGDFVVTEAFPIAQYIIERFGPSELLGQNQADRGVIQMYLWTIDTMGNIININCTNKNEKEIEKVKNEQWENVVLPRLHKYQSFSKENNWFLGYLTIIDFSIYELVRYIEMLFPGKTTPLVRLNYIKNRIYELPEIKAYENSPRAITEMDPSTLLKKFKASQP